MCALHPQPTSNNPARTTTKKQSQGAASTSRHVSLKSRRAMPRSPTVTIAPKITATGRSGRRTTPLNRAEQTSGLLSIDYFWRKVTAEEQRAPGENGRGLQERGWRGRFRRTLNRTSTRPCKMSKTSRNKINVSIQARRSHQ